MCISTFFYIHKCIYGFNRLLKKLITNVYLYFKVITGSTDGIGKSFANEFAKIGMNIILISRSEEKLRNTAKEIGNVLMI